VLLVEHRGPLLAYDALVERGEKDALSLQDLALALVEPKVAPLVAIFLGIFDAQMEVRAAHL